MKDDSGIRTGNLEEQFPGKKTGPESKTDDWLLFRILMNQ